MKYVITQLEGELWGKICDFHLRLSWGLPDWRAGDPLDALGDAERRELSGFGVTLILGACPRAEPLGLSLGDLTLSCIH